MLEPIIDSIASIGSEVNALEQSVKSNAGKKALLELIATLKTTLLKTVERVKEKEEDIQEFKLNTLSTTNPEVFDGAAVVAIRSPFSIYQRTP